MNNKIILEDKYILEYIEYSLKESMVGVKNVDDFIYHHNSSYDKTKSILENGILSMNDLNSKGIITYSDEILKNMSNIESHVNGIDGISLSVTGLDDLYPNEDEWDPFNEYYADFLVSEVNAYRSSINYGNEFIATNSISNDKIKSVDIRILGHKKLIDRKKNYYSLEADIKRIVNNYNCLSGIASTILKNDLNIPLRENSEFKNNMLNLEKVASYPTIEIKSLLK